MNAKSNFSPDYIVALCLYNIKTFNVSFFKPYIPKIMSHHTKTPINALILNKVFMGQLTWELITYRIK
jgi:hypothetical protein